MTYKFLVFNKFSPGIKMATDQSEIINGFKVEQNERVAEENIIDALKNWSSAGEDRSVASLNFASTPNMRASEKVKSSYNFFHRPVK